MNSMRASLLGEGARRLKFFEKQPLQSELAHAPKLRKGCACILPMLKRVLGLHQRTKVDCLVGARQVWRYSPVDRRYNSGAVPRGSHLLVDEFDAPQTLSPVA
jgi:hypothetical protein